ncbi:MAG: Gfo/Idh/MocA family oxidoreductase [Planctomycetota bacterium]
MTEPTPPLQRVKAARSPLRLGVAGVGGYGDTVLRAVETFGPTLETPIETAAVYEALPDRAGERLASLKSSGVAVYGEYGEMVNDPSLDAVWLPVPIHLHLPMTLEALRAGKAVMCEKPAAGSTAELDAMIAGRDASGLPLLIGFQEVYSPLTRALKQRLLDGVIGEVKRVSVRACWPRDSSYFGRNNWAGRREVVGRPVHDSPLSNALAHFVNLSLLFAGVDGLDQSAAPIKPRVSLYRVNPIENFDTVTLACATEAGPEVLVWMTHACESGVEPVIRIDGSTGRVTRTLQEVRIEVPGRPDEVIPVDGRNVQPMYEAFAGVLSGHGGGASILATPELVRPHTSLVEQLAACPIHTVPADRIVEAERADGSVLRSLPGIEERFARAQNDGEAPLDLLVGA